MNIARLIEASYREAAHSLTMGTSPRALARARERALIKTLVAHFQRAGGAEDHRVFSTLRRGNAADFGANRLLHDIAVCRIATGTTAERQAEDFRYIAEALWQVEVDFSRDWRKAIVAINRLTCGAAPQKLLIAAAPARGLERFLETLRAPASASRGELNLALVPHPADWDDDLRAPQVWRLVDGDWRELA